MFSNNKRILILSPHTDDAELGCGATISRFIEAGMEIFWICFSTAEDSLPEGFPRDALETEFRQVLNFLNIGEESSLILNYEVRKLSEVRQDVLEILVRIRSSFKPDVVIGPSLSDFHQDHQVVANEMIRAFKSSASIISYELPWNHVDFKTQLFSKIDSTNLAKKVEMLSFYKTQLVAKRQYFNKEFITGLARVRGTQVNHPYAESFEVIRWQL
jgi:LmbE family N-acetylglucosaminyl deacetylase